MYIYYISIEYFQTELGSKQPAASASGFYALFSMIEFSTMYQVQYTAVQVRSGWDSLHVTSSTSGECTTTFYLVYNCFTYKTYVYMYSIFFFFVFYAQQQQHWWPHRVCWHSFSPSSCTSSSLAAAHHEQRSYVVRRNVGVLVCMYYY